MKQEQIRGEFEEWYEKTRAPIGDGFPATTKQITDFFLQKRSQEFEELKRRIRENSENIDFDEGEDTYILTSKVLEIIKEIYGK